MKISWSFLCLFLIVSCIDLSGQSKVQKYAVKSGYVEYQVTGNTTGEKKIWWDDYGLKSRTEENTVTVVKVFGVKNETKTHTVSVVKDGKFWSADLLEHTGQTGTVPDFGGMSGHDDLSEAELKKMEQEILDALGGKKLGTETFLGYTCEVIELMGAKSWIHQGVLLKSEVKLLGVSSVETAIKFDKNVNIPAIRFDPPDGIAYESTDNLMYEYFDGDDDEEYDGEEDFIPVNYPFSKFREITKGFNYKGYRSVMVISEDGQHLATYMKGMTTLSVLATSEHEARDVVTEEDFETFTHRGRTYHYGKTEESEGMEGTALIEYYPEHSMYISYFAVPGMSKEALLEISEKLRF